MIKFLKKFKEKILIALACSFIGIGTLLSNTIETKAYVSDDFSYTLTYDSVNGNYLRFNLNEPITTNSNYTNCYFYMVLIECDLSRFNISTGTRLQYNFRYNNANESLSYYYYRTFTDGNFDIFYRFSDFFNVTSSWTYFDFYISNYNLTISDIIHIDLISVDNLSTYEYIYNFYGNLQSQYDSLQAEYTNYQNTHAYTNEQYNALMNQNATLTQQVQSLQSQYDTYVNLHSYTNEQYETLLANYNSLQNMYSNLQANYLSLQQQYENLALSVAPFTSSKWNNRTGSLNGVTYDMQNEYRDSLVSFEKTYLFVYPRDSDVFDSFSDSTNIFVLTAYCNDVVTLSSFNVIANLSHLREEYFQIDFYLYNSLVYSTIDFDNDMGEDDSNTISVDRFLQFNQITVTVVFTGVDSTIYGPGSYFNAVVGTWQNGYDYAVGQLMPQINQLEQDLQQSNDQQQVKYNEGFNAGFDSRIILNHYTE